MQVSKQQVVEFIRQRGDDDRAGRAEAELPDAVDLPKDEDLVTQVRGGPAGPGRGRAGRAGLSGAACQVRTDDLSLTRRVLYQLS